MLRDLPGQRVLLLQGPNGPFFQRFAADLRARGCEVTKVNFNSGDDLFYRGPNLVRFNRPMAEWPAYCRALVLERGIQAMFVYGDQRPIHREAIAIAADHDIAVWVLEEGYLRPDFVTVERGGANANSSLPRDPSFYRQASADLGELPPPLPVGNTFRPHGWWTAMHSTAFTFFSHRYLHYRHHRDINCFKEAFYWTRAGVRKLLYERQERGLLERITAEGAPPFFLVPLQVHCDAQLQHSQYGGMEELLEEIVSTFAAHAPPRTKLVVKHHPHDRGYTDFAPTLIALGDRHGCGARIDYVHDLHLPTLLKSARGVITMNSTVGLSALYHGTPVKVLGDAIYDMPDLTAQKPLAEFLVDPGPVDEAIVAAFIRYLREDNQVNGSFYKQSRGFAACGLDLTRLGPPIDGQGTTAEADGRAPSVDRFT